MDCARTSGRQIHASYITCLGDVAAAGTLPTYLPICVRDEHFMRIGIASRTPLPLDYEVWLSWRLMLRRRIQCAVRDVEISFDMFLFMFLQVLCMSCKFLTRVLQILRNFSARFLLILLFRSFIHGRCWCSLLCLTWRFGRTREFNARSGARSH